jgi:hypothetical protein
MKMGNIFTGLVNSTLKRFVAVAMVGSLVVTSGMFAYAYTAASTSITATTGSADFASISANNTVAGYTIFGSYRGTIGSGTLFNVTPSTGYTGDLQVNVYIANPDELGKNYGLWMLRVRLVDGSDDYQDMEAYAKVLSLNNGVVSFISDNLTAGTTYFVKTTGGVWRSFPWVYLTLGSIYSPSLYAEVVQVGP